MKKNCALMLTVFMLMLSLTACGRSSKDPGKNNSPVEPPAVENSTGAPANNDALGNALDDAANDAKNAIDDILPDDNKSHTDQGGVSFGDMLENVSEMF